LLEKLQETDMIKVVPWEVCKASLRKLLYRKGQLTFAFLSFFSVFNSQLNIQPVTAENIVVKTPKVTSKNFFGDPPLPGYSTAVHRSSAAAVANIGLGSNECTAEEINFFTIADEYLKDSFRFKPTFATQLGVHAFDDQLENPSVDSRLKENKLNEQTLVMLDGMSTSAWSLSARDDLELLRSHIKSEIFESEVLKEWKRNPDHYSSFLGETIFPLIKRDFAPLDVRLRSVIERERKMPEFLAIARKNIDRAAVPRVFAEIADEQLPGIIEFFETDVPNAVKDAKAPQLLEEFRRSNHAVVEALVDYHKFVKGLLTDKDACKGEFAIGRSNLQKMLEVQQMVDEPIDSLLSKGERELARLQAEFLETAKAINPKATESELFDSISRNHPPADKLLVSVKDVLANIRAYIIDHKIVTIPGADNLIVEDTPPFMRATTFAAMEAPGAFEKKAKEAFYFVTLPEKKWDAKHTEEYMRAYTYPDLLSTSIHEAYPGHYVQALWNKQLKTNVRRAFDCSSNAEGWAHYCEQMMLDQGYKKDDASLKLVQIHDALLRCCRYIVAIKMHTQGMTIAQATDFFIKEGYQEKSNATLEAKRGTVDPTYLVYTLGKLQILAMRDDVKKAQGDSFSLLKFHDAFLSVGGPPLKIVRAELWNELGLK
jgi:uncharacterized protein (DUF885 family)